VLSSSVVRRSVRSIPWPPRQLEGFSAAFARDCPSRFIRDVGCGEGLVQPDQRKTGHRIKYAKVDADTGEEVAADDIVKGYKVDTDTYIEVTKDELDELRWNRRTPSRSTSSCRRRTSTIAI